MGYCSQECIKAQLARITLCGLHALTAACPLLMLGSRYLAICIDRNTPIVRRHHLVPGVQPHG